jgi:hypothetical protein
MMDSKRPFVVDWRVQNRPHIRRDLSVPAFGNCSLDDNPGVGDLRNGTAIDSQINGYLSWDSVSIVDEPDRWEMTVILDDSAPLGECTADLTPRKCQKFKAPPGQKFKWTCAALSAPTASDSGKPGKSKGAGNRSTGGLAAATSPAAGRPPAQEAGKLSGAGEALADKSGLVTIPALRMTKGQQRVVIARQ